MQSRFHAGFEAAFAAWQTTLEQQAKSPRTIEEYGRFVRIVQRDVCDLLGDPAAAKTALQGWRARMHAKSKKSDVAPSTIRSYICAVRSFFGYLVDAGLAEENLAKQLTIPSVKPGLPRPVETEAVDRMFSAVDATTPAGLRDLAMVWLYYSSIRNSEVNALTTAHISYQPSDGGLVLRFPAKRGKERVVVLRAEASEVLALHLFRTFPAPLAAEVYQSQLADLSHREMPLRDARYQALLLAVDWLLVVHLKGTPKRVFVRNDGKPFSRRDANRLFQQYRERANLPARDASGARIAPHGLRHTIATDLLNDGVDIRVVQEILGHSSIRQTEIYTQVLTSTKAKAMQRQRVPKGAVVAQSEEVHA